MAPTSSAIPPLRILALFPQLGGNGGVQLAGRETAFALTEIGDRHGFANSFLSLNDPAGQQTVSVAGRSIELRGFARSKASFVLSAIRIARTMPRTGPRVILALHPNLARPAVWARCFARSTKIAVVSHGVEVWQPLSRLGRRALGRADMLLAPSRFTCEALHSVQSVPSEKIRLLPWSLSPSMLALSHSSPAPPPDFPRGRVILSVARWSTSERYKGADELIRAVAQILPDHPGLHLVLAGDGDDLSRLRALAKSLDTLGRIHFLGGVSDEALASYYAHADIFALPSSGEGFGFVFLEAMAFANPVVAVRAGGLTDIVKDGINGLLVQASDVQELAGALARLLREDALRKRLGDSGAEIVRRDYSFSSFVARLESLLRELGLLP